MVANVLSSEACRYYCWPSKRFFFQIWWGYYLTSRVYKWKNDNFVLPPEYGNQIFGDYANRIRACFTTAVTIMYGAYIYTFWIVVILERSGAKSTFESKFDVGVKMTKCECTGGPAGSQVLAWEKSSSEGGPARFLHFHKIFISCEMFSDDAKLLQFLRGCKFSLERTKEKLDLYNSCRSKHKLSLFGENVLPFTQGQPSWLVWTMGPISTNLPEDSQLQAKPTFASEHSKAVILTPTWFRLLLLVTK